MKVGNMPVKQGLASLLVQTYQKKLHHNISSLENWMIGKILFFHMFLFREKSIDPSTVNQKLQIVLSCSPFCHSNKILIYKEFEYNACLNIILLQ